MQVIGFAFEYLAREAFPQPGLLLIPGSATFLLANLGRDGSAVVLEPLRFVAAQVVLFAVNDNPDVEHAEGGSHWSLLAYCATDDTFRHYSSLQGSNHRAARRLFEAARRPGSTLCEQATPQQRNGHDCGVYVMALARLLCQRYSEQGQRMSFELAPDAVTPADVAALRRELLELIHSKAAAEAVAVGS